MDTICELSWTPLWHIIFSIPDSPGHLMWFAQDPLGHNLCFSPDPPGHNLWFELAPLGHINFCPLLTPPTKLTLFRGGCMLIKWNSPLLTIREYQNFLEECKLIVGGASVACVVYYRYPISMVFGIMQEYCRRLLVLPDTFMYTTFNYKQEWFYEWSHNECFSTELKPSDRLNLYLASSVVAKLFMRGNFA